MRSKVEAKLYIGTGISIYYFVHVYQVSAYPTMPDPREARYAAVASAGIDADPPDEVNVAVIIECLGV